ncbi:hypothetical protein VU04_02020 [Desulfobulbus sp. TB]|nr:hypothetical protein [Desulfobulbus sp. TB]
MSIGLVDRILTDWYMLGPTLAENISPYNEWILDSVQILTPVYFLWGIFFAIIFAVFKAIPFKIKIFIFSGSFSFFLILLWIIAWVLKIKPSGMWDIPGVLLAWSSIILLPISILIFLFQVAKYFAINKSSQTTTS